MVVLGDAGFVKGRPEWHEPGDFGAGVEALASDAPLRQALGARGRAYVDARYRWPAVVERWREFLGRVFP